MARFDERSGQLYVTELGRVASHFYIRHASIVAFNAHLKPHMSEAEVCQIRFGLVMQIPLTSLPSMAEEAAHPLYTGLKDQSWTVSRLLCCSSTAPASMHQVARACGLAEVSQQSVCTACECDIPFPDDHYLA